MLTTRNVTAAPSVQSVFVAFVATAIVASATVHSIALLGLQVFPHSLHIAAADLTSATVLISAGFSLAILILNEERLRVFAVALPVVAGAWISLRAGAPAAGLALGFVGILQTFVASKLASRTSVTVRIHGPKALLWALAALLLLVQAARLSTFMADPSFDWYLTTRNPLWAQHMCMPAYIQAADMHRQGVRNVYAAEYYPVLVRKAKPPITVRNMDAFVGDPFQYPPQFLALPLLALKATNDFLAMRTVWYSIQVLAFLASALALGWSIAGKAGATAIWLIPIAALSLPVLQSLQYGQFHLMAVALTVAAFAAFERRRSPLGGALLAAAILSKIFPGVLVLLLVAQKRWRDLAWTVALAAVFTGVALIVLGWQPFDAFIRYQMPRLADGRAFDFAAEWPEMRLPLAVLDNIAPTAVLLKLQELGVAGALALGPWVRGGFNLLVIGIVLVAARRTASTRERAIVWLALVNLASLQGFAGWADYITLGSVWMLTLMADDMRRSATAAVLLGICWFFCALLPGGQPIPEFLPTTLALVLTTVLAVLVVALNVAAIVQRHPSPADI